jgi:signal transduction histidine kinase
VANYGSNGVSASDYSADAVSIAGESQHKSLESLMKGLDNDDVEHLIHSAKMSAIGQITAGIVHEINTPLAYMNATFVLLSNRLDELLECVDPQKKPEIQSRIYPIKKDIHTLLADVRHGTEQISKLVSSLRNFSRLESDRFAVSSVVAILDDALLMAHNKLKYLEVTKEISEVPNIRCAASQIGQVLLNILINAAQAVESGDREGRIDVRVACPDNFHVAIIVSDNGPGIPSAIRDRIFEPFFTTKPAGEGTGLGLSISYRIIRNHGGTITVDSSEEGTVFSVILPVAKEGRPFAAM